ncbi:MAG TPA: GAF domain-containing protein [Chloroflexota bacterium]
MRPDSGTLGTPDPLALTRLLQRLTNLFDLSRDVVAELELDRLLQTIMARSSQALDADRSTLFVVDEANNQLWSHIAQGLDTTEIRMPKFLGLAGHVAMTGATVNVPDAYQDDRFNQGIDRQTGYKTRSVLAMPIHDTSGSIVGVLEALNKKTGAVFTSEDETLCTILCSYIEVALTNSALMQARKKEEEKSAILLDVMRSLASEIELDNLLERIMAKTTEVMHADRSSLYLIDHKTNELWFKVAQGADLQEVRFPVGVGIAGQVAATAEIVNIEDAHEDARFNPEMDRRTGYRTRSMLCMAIQDSAGKRMGVLQVLNKDSGVFTREDEEMLGAICSQAAIALANAELFDDVVRMKNYNESVLHSMAAGVVTLDMEGCVSTTNAAAERILGLEVEMPAGARFGEIIGEQNSELAEIAHRALEGGEARRVDKLRYLNPVRNPVTMNVSAVPLRDAKEKQIGLVMVIEDISREQQLMGTLSRVVSRELAEQIMASGVMPEVGGERKQVTILMSDIRDFTTMTESAEPEDIVHMLNDYFSRMIQVIFEYEGTLDKFIGDAIMGVFGTPVTHDNDPVRAVLAGVGMRRALHKFNDDRRAAGKLGIEIGIGICDGEAIAGAIGSEERMEFTVIGDAVNTASRIEGLTKGFPGHKLVFNETIFEIVKNLVPCDFLAEEFVKGKAQAVRVYGVPESFILSDLPVTLAAASI